MIGVRVVNGNKTKGLIAVVDSGCDVTLAHTDIGTLVGIDVPTGRPYSYTGSQAGNPSLAYIHTVHLIIVNHTWVDLDIAFSDEMPQGFLLLGQRGFFESFDIKFCLSREASSRLRSCPARLALSSTSWLGQVGFRQSSRQAAWASGLRCLATWDSSVSRSSCTWLVSLVTGFRRNVCRDVWKLTSLSMPALVIHALIVLRVLRQRAANHLMNGTKGTTARSPN